MSSLSKRREEMVKLVQPYADRIAALKAERDELKAKLEAMGRAAQDLLDWHDGVLGRGPALDAAKAAPRKAVAAQQEQEDE